MEFSSLHGIFASGSIYMSYFSIALLIVLLLLFVSIDCLQDVTGMQFRAYISVNQESSVGQRNPGFALSSNTYRVFHGIRLSIPRRVGFCGHLVTLCIHVSLLLR